MRIPKGQNFPKVFLAFISCKAIPSCWSICYVCLKKETPYKMWSNFFFQYITWFYLYIVCEGATTEAVLLGFTVGMEWWCWGGCGCQWQTKISKDDRHWITLPFLFFPSSFLELIEEKKNCHRSAVFADIKGIINYNNKLFNLLAKIKHSICSIS